MKLKLTWGKVVGGSVLLLGALGLYKGSQRSKIPQGMMTMSDSTITAAASLKNPELDQCSVKGMYAANNWSWHEVIRREVRHAPENVRKAYEGASQHQRKEIIDRFVKDKLEKTHPYDPFSDLDGARYTLACTFSLGALYPKKVPLAIPWETFLKEYVAPALESSNPKYVNPLPPEYQAALQAAEAAKAPKCKPEDAVKYVDGCTKADSFAAMRDALLRKISLPLYIVGTEQGAVSPAKGKPGENLEVTIHGTALNLFGENNSLPEGLSISFGEGISVIKQERTDKGEIRVFITIVENAATGKRNVALSIGDKQIEEVKEAFEVTKGTGRTGGEVKGSGEVKEVPSTSPSNEYKEAPPRPKSTGEAPKPKAKTAEEEAPPPPPKPKRKSKLDELLEQAE